MIGNINGATAEERGRWFWLLDSAGSPITGAAGDVEVSLRRGGVTAAASGSVTEPLSGTHPGLYLYDPSTPERVAGGGLLIVEHEDQMAPAPVWPFLWTEGDVTEAPLSPEEYAGAARDALLSDLEEIESAVSSIPSLAPGDVAEAVSSAIQGADLPSRADLPPAPDNAGIAAARTAAQEAAGAAATLVARLTEERAAVLDRDLAERGDAMSLDVETLAALEVDVAAALEEAGFTQQLARMLLKAGAWGGGGGSATRASATTPTFQVTAPGGESLGTITVTTDADGRLLGISASEAG